MSPSELTALINQTLEYAYPAVSVIGELSSFKIAKEKWVYTDIKDDRAKLRCFGTVFQLPGPLEDGMMVQIIAEPRLHPQFGFSLQIKQIRPVGEGSIKKAANLLKSKLEKEGLFALERKRNVAYPPETVGLIASEQSAGYADFIKIMNSRWRGVDVEVYDTLVQGDSAVESLLSAMNYFNQLSKQPDVLVMIRGGGSADDLSAFSAEQVTRAVAGSRIPTLIAIGHEVDESLAELAADMRASTPSNAAELLFPDRKEILNNFKLTEKNLQNKVTSLIDLKGVSLSEITNSMTKSVSYNLQQKESQLDNAQTLLNSVHPTAVLKRGYTLTRVKGRIVKSVNDLSIGDAADVTFYDGEARASVISKLKSSRK